MQNNIPNKVQIRLDPINNIDILTGEIDHPNKILRLINNLTIEQLIELIYISPFWCRHCIPRIGAFDLI